MIGLPPITWQAVLLGLTVLVAGIVLAWLVRRVVDRVLRWRGRSESSATVFAGLTQLAVVTVAIGAALTIVFPSVKPVNVLGGIGIISIAAGIAFQTVLGNMFAGMVILARDRFRVGDQIRVGDHAGQVVHMGLSSTSMRTFDGRLVLIPNASLHSEIVTIQTGFERVRSAVRLDLDDATDLREACRVALAALDGVPEISDDPAPQALLTEIGSATVALELRFWSGARQLETREAIHAAILAVLEAFAAAGVRTGSDVQVIDVGPVLARQLARGLTGGPAQP